MNRQSTTDAWMIDPQQYLIGNKNCNRERKKIAHFRLPINLHSKVTNHHFLDTNHDDDDDPTAAQVILSRRCILQRISLVATAAALTGTSSSSSVANADDAVDPLAQMDAIAAQINGGSSAGSGGAVSAGLGSDSVKRSGYPESISPLPTAKYSEYDLVNDPPDVGSTTGGSGGGPTTDLQKALKESQSRKKIDPRTHG